MSSSDPVTGDNSPKRASRPPKRVHEDQDAAPRKARTPPSDKFARKRTLKREPEPVFVFPELDEDGNPIEDELSDNPRAAQLSSASSPVRLKVPDVPGAMRAAADEFSTTMRSPSKPSPARDAVAANLPPSSIELPNMLADRIYRASPARATRLPETARQTPVKDSPKHDEAFTPAPAKADRLAPALKSQGLAGGSIQEQEKAKRLAPTSSPIAKLVAAVPKQLSAADLRAVAEVLDDLDSQVFSDVDADVPAVSGRRAEHGSIAVEGSEPLPAGAPSVTASSAAPDARGRVLHAGFNERAPDQPVPAKLPPASEAQGPEKSAPTETAPASKPAPSVPAARVELKPLRRVPSPPPRPASYRLVGNSLEGAIAHLRNVFNETIREAGSQSHEVAYLRSETNRLADELEARNTAIGELLEEKRNLEVELDEARRSEADFDLERTAWDVERAQYEQKIDVLKEIRRGLLDEIRALQADLAFGGAEEDDGRKTSTIDAQREEYQELPSAPTSLRGTRVEEEMVAATADTPAVEATAASLAPDVKLSTAGPTEL